MTKAEILKQLVAEVQELIPAPAGTTYTMEYAPIYGGYRLCLTRTENGGQFGCFGGNGTEPRVKFDVMCLKLRTIISVAQQLQSK